MKHLKAIVIGIIIIVILIVGGFFFTLNSIGKKPFISDGDVNITITAGEGFYGVLDDLASKNYIKHETLIKLYVKLHGITPKITPGEYTISKDVTLDKFMEILNTQSTIKIVIPEGYTVEQIAETFQKMGLFSKEQFLSALEKYPLPTYVKKVNGRRYALEGYLFPDTYDFSRGESPDNVIKTMLNQFEKTFKKAEENTGVTVPVGEIDNIITKASVIEREANTLNDMRRVSGVIDNRLKVNMKLQIDATVIYALGHHVNVVTYKDLEVKSPYNTYMYKGLPIGPICNPGLNAIEAALNPIKSNDIYYILTGKEHFFTPSYDEFLKAKEQMNKQNSNN